jgi:uncharacterized protein
MISTRNIDLIRRGYAAFAARDIEAMRALLASDVVHTVPGNSALSGVHKGRDAVLAMYGRAYELSGGSLAIEPTLIQADEADRVLAAFRATAHRDGRLLDEVASVVFTITDGRVADIHEFRTDTRAQEEFLGLASAG